MEKEKRTLIYFPIVHTRADLGNLHEQVRMASLKKMGKEGWSRKTDAIDEYWTKIEHLIDGLDFSYEHVRIYQDGLPVCGKELQIVTDLADAGSRNHRLLLGMIKKGAVITGTESAELLVQEYELIKKAMLSCENGNHEENSRDKLFGDSLLKKRDRFIAARINETLEKSETGILFLGMLHSIEGLLKSDIRVIYPLNEEDHQGDEK